MKTAILLALVLVASANAFDHTKDSSDQVRMLRNRDEVEVDVHGHRELWGSGFGWSNLLCKYL
jgi:hypothetical protein